MNPLRTLIDYCEYLFVRLFWALYGLIPTKRAYDIGAAATRAFYPLFRKRRHIAVDNILKAGITSSPEEADRIARKAFGHLGGHICEALKIGGVVTPANWREHIVWDGPEDSRKLLWETPDTPVMILTGHLGTWEAAVSIISITRPMIAVARKMNNPFVERFMKAHHFRGQITIVPKKHGFTANVLRLWKQQCAAMTLVMDQHAGKQGIRVPFFGRPAFTHTSPARLHLQTGAPILVGGFVRESAFVYRMVTDHPLRFTSTGDHARDIEALLTEINRRLETVIRRYPEQYLWAHKRWR